MCLSTPRFLRQLVLIIQEEIGIFGACGIIRLVTCRVCKSEVNNTQCEKYAEKTLVLLGQVVTMACTKEDCQITESGLEIYHAWIKGG